MIWHMLWAIYEGGRVVEIMAASSCDGIGIIARWSAAGDGWAVTAMDTESTNGMCEVTDFHEGECVPPEPPTEFANKESL